MDTSPSSKAEVDRPEGVVPLFRARPMLELSRGTREKWARAARSLPSKASVLMALIVGKLKNLTS